MLGGGRTFSGASLGRFDPENAARVVLACWATVLIIFAALPEDSFGRVLAAAGASWTAELFAGIALIFALLRSSGAGRLFWAIFGGAVFVRYAGDLVWTDSGIFGVDLLPAHQVVADTVSYPLFFGALLWLVGQSRRELTPVAVLDTTGAMLSSGLLLWFFVLDPATVPADLDRWEASTALVQPIGDIGLFLLALGILLTIRRPFAIYLTGGLLLFLVTDGAYLLELRTSGTYVLGGWPVLFWVGSVALLGVAALHWRSAEPLAQGGPRSDNLETFLFWLGPLSPPLQCGALLVWGVLHPPLPVYVLICGAVVLGVFAVRTCAAQTMRAGCSPAGGRRWP